MTIESDNAREEIREIVERCFKCGLCKELCPVLRVLRKEQSGPRGKAIMLDCKYIDKIVYYCTLCKACEKKCPLNLKLCTAFVKARQIVASKDELPEAKEMVKNLQETGDIYGRG
jgi:glycolate oxidase iron-sulfur subunit